MVTLFFVVWCLFLLRCEGGTLLNTARLAQHLVVCVCRGAPDTTMSCWLLLWVPSHAPPTCPPLGLGGFHLRLKSCNAQTQKQDNGPTVPPRRMTVFVPSCYYQVAAPPATAAHTGAAPCIVIRATPRRKHTAPSMQEWSPGAARNAVPPVSCGFSAVGGFGLNHPCAPTSIPCTPPPACCNHYYCLLQMQLHGRRCQSVSSSGAVT